MSSKQRLLAVLVCLPLLIVPITYKAGPEESPMTTAADCNKSPVDKSRCMIETVLADIKKTYTHTGGGGIIDIKMDATNTYTVSIAQEERVDTITYVLDVKANGSVVIVKRTEGTKSRGD